MSQVTRKNINLDAVSATYAPQISGLKAGEDGIKEGMPCRVNSNGEIVRSNATNKGDGAEVHGLAASDADTGDPVSLYGEGIRYRYNSDGNLTPGQDLYLDEANGELNDEPTTGDPEGIAVAVTSEDIVLTDTTQPDPRDQAVVSGGSAGDIGVTGIEVGDVLEHVIQVVGAGTDVTDVADLTSEFSIASDGTINNGGGTDTSGDKLLVIWRDLT